MVNRLSPFPAGRQVCGGLLPNSAPGADFHRQELLTFANYGR